MEIQELIFIFKRLQAIRKFGPLFYGYYCAPQFKLAMKRWQAVPSWAPSSLITWPHQCIRIVGGFEIQTVSSLYFVRTLVPCEPSWTSGVHREHPTYPTGSPD
ncbi:hypothetical protein WA026_023111 [Henosepilachna vigintioctopunctata]|uniref:Uncharacterized protein n=1 Tax=Henosepilachna vigintioctopunctata TaxID=420089 RepID=A0AAW1UD85_9CUCU